MPERGPLSPLIFRAEVFFFFFFFFGLSNWKYNSVLSISRRDKRSPGEFRFDILHDFDALMYSASLVNVINRSK